MVSCPLGGNEKLTCELPLQNKQFHSEGFLSAWCLGGFKHAGMRVSEQQRDSIHAARLGLGPSMGLMCFRASSPNGATQKPDMATPCAENFKSQVLPGRSTDVRAGFAA